MQTFDNISDQQKTSISKSKKLVFNLILLLIPILLFSFLEIGLRLSHYGKDMKLFFKSVNYPGYMEINPEVTLRYFSKVEETSPTSDIFLINKPDTCYRVFVFGGSTTKGFPYHAGSSFPRILYYRLQDAFPHKRIEVVNLSASAVSSYTYIDMVDEVLAHKPDLILVYGGHNEYYGSMGVGSIEKGGNFRWMKKINLALKPLRTYQLLQSTIVKMGRKLAPQVQNGDETLMKRIVDEKSIVLGSKLYQKGVDQFKLNMEEIVRKANKKNVPIVLSELVSNVNDLPPFESVKSDKYPAAIEVFNQAKELEAEGKIDEARKLYYEAKDLDIIRFRAPEAMNDIIHQLCDEYQLPLVPMQRYFEEKSPNGLIGNEYILEHLHPNIDGYFLMAEAFFNTLRENHLISNDWDSANIKSTNYYRSNWGFTELDSLIADLNIKSLEAGWPFKPESEANLFLRVYQPVSYVDSMAFHYLTSPVKHIEDEHINLAVHYGQINENEKAFQEYYSLIKLHPYIGDLYYDASKYLIAQQKYAQALDLINSAPLMAHDYFYYYMQGTLKIKLNKTQEGIEDLEYALKNRTSEDKPTKVLIPLYLTYRELGDTINKTRILDSIKTYLPNFKEPVEVAKNEGQKGGVHEERIKISISEIYDRAIGFIEKNETGKALDLLLKTDKVKENASIKKLIGMIYFKEKDFPLAYKYSSESFALNPYDYDNLNNYFVLTLMKKDMTKAAEILHRLPNLKVEPDKIARFNQLYEKRRKELEAAQPANSTKQN